MKLNIDVTKRYERSVNREGSQNEFMDFIEQKAKGKFPATKKVSFFRSLLNRLLLKRRFEKIVLSPGGTRLKAKKIYGDKDHVFLWVGTEIYMLKKCNGEYLLHQVYGVKDLNCCSIKGAKIISG